jgi:hypothetical protein
VFDDYIFVRPGFRRGAARALDLRGSLGRDAFVISPSTRDADARAVESDFRVVNRDMQAALEALEPVDARGDAQE